MLPDRMPRLAAGPVVLRAFDERDVDLVRSAAADPMIPLITTVPASGTYADALAFVERQRGRLAEGVGFSFAIADAASDAAVGQIGLWLRDLPDGRASVGYWLGPGHRGRGYAAAALRTLTTWALAMPEIARLQLYVEPSNEASWRLAQRCGYAREGLLRSWQRVGAERRDMYVYAAVAADVGRHGRG